MLLGCRIDDTARCAYYVSPIRDLHHVSFFGACLDDTFASLASLHGLVVTCGHAGHERVAVIARETSSLWAEGPAVPELYRIVCWRFWWRRFCAVQWRWGYIPPSCRAMRGPKCPASGLPQKVHGAIFGSCVVEPTASEPRSNTPCTLMFACSCFLFMVRSTLLRSLAGQSPSTRLTTCDTRMTRTSLMRTV